MFWSRDKALAWIREAGVIPIVRAASPDDALRAVDAVVEGGIRIAEITMTVPNALRVLQRLVDTHGERVLLGAGTILDGESCRAALEAGAQFIVTPGLDVKVIEMAKRHSKVVMPGALSPTEILAAWQAGADMVKVFPIGPVGGPKYLRALRGPFPHIEFVPTGGVDLATAPAFIKAGAAAIAVGGELVSAKALQEGDARAIAEAARQYLDAVRSARSAE